MALEHQLCALALLQLISSAPAAEAAGPRDSRVPAFLDLHGAYSVPFTWKSLKPLYKSWAPTCLSGNPRQQPSVTQGRSRYSCRHSHSIYNLYAAVPGTKSSWWLSTCAAALYRIPDQLLAPHLKYSATDFTHSPQTKFLQGLLPELGCDEHGVGSEQCQTDGEGKSVTWIWKWFLSWMHGILWVWLFLKTFWRCFAGGQSPE